MDKGYFMNLKMRFLRLLITTNRGYGYATEFIGGKHLLFLETFQITDICVETGVGIGFITENKASSKISAGNG